MIAARLLNFLTRSNLQETEPMWLLVGLGNPGDKYAHNRHNVGFMAIDQIASDYGFPPFRAKFEGHLSEGRIGDEKVALLKPQTYMNESGISLGQAVRFFKITPNRVIVFYDELDLQPFQLKVKKGGGTAGHNGLKSIDAHLGRQEYWKVRLGIGHPGDKNRVSGYVLSDFSKEEQKHLPHWIEEVARHTPLLLEDNQADFMTRVAEGIKKYGV